MKRSYSFVTDPKLRVKAWDWSIGNLTEKTPLAVLGKKYHEIFPKMMVGGRDALSLALKENRTITLKGHRFCCLYDHITADVQISPVAAPDGSVEGVKVTMHLTETCSLANKLNSSRQLIEIGKIASTLAHGVRSPLNAIKGAVIYLRERYAHEPTLIDFTSIMEAEIARLDTFISRFLSTSISDGLPRETDINSLLRKIEVIISLQAQSFAIEVIHDYGDVPPVMANPFQIEQAFLNVINNALEAMKASGGQLRVKTRSESLSGQEFVVVQISDTGAGMATGRSNEAPPSEGRARGFGLFITREILQGHGGRLEMKSERDTGTTVKMYVPVKCEVAPGGG